MEQKHFQLAEFVQLMQYPAFFQVEAVIEKIIEEARTGEIGDGKIFGKIPYYV